MIIRGQISNGVVQTEGQVPLPNGTQVIIVPADQPAASEAHGDGSGHRVQLPLVPSASPGSIALDSQRIAELLDDSAAP